MIAAPSFYHSSFWLTTCGLILCISPVHNGQAVVLVADKKFSLKVTGLGDVLAPNGGVIGEH